MKLQDWLDREGITDMEFARRIGVSKGTISRIRRGLNTPSLDTLAKICDFTKNEVSINDFLGDGRSR